MQRATSPGVSRHIARDADSKRGRDVTPDIDAFNLNTGSLDATLNNSSPNTVYVGNDVDSMYGLRSYRRSTGEYVITKDNYNGSSVVVYRWTP